MTRYGKVPSSSQIQGQVPNVLPSLIATGSPCGPSQERSGAVSGMNEEIITHTKKVVANVRPSFQRDPSVTTLYSPPCSPCSWPPRRKNGSRTGRPPPWSQHSCPGPFLHGRISQRSLTDCDVVVSPSRLELLDVDGRLLLVLEVGGLLLLILEKLPHRSRTSQHLSHPSAPNGPPPAWLPLHFSFPGAKLLQSIHCQIKKGMTADCKRLSTLL